MLFLYQFWAWLGMDISDGSDADHDQPGEDLSTSEGDNDISSVGESRSYWFMIQSIAIK